METAVIAAMAIQNSANLVSVDQAFAKVAQLTVLGW
jgi:predicted nucleic acid-binding protein